MQLAHKTGEKPFKNWLNHILTALKTLHHKGGYRPGHLDDEKAYRQLILETARIFDMRIRETSLPAYMRDMFRKNVFIFSGLKTHTALTEAARYLVDRNGNLVPFEKWYRHVSKKVAATHRRYLQAEYNYATGAVQMAHRWHKLLDGDPPGRVILQYRTANDERVRASHRPLHNITLPASDPFWEKYYPPNGWNCRCTVARVESSAKTSDPDKARKLGRKATTYLTRSGKNKLAIFRMNPAKQKIIFPENHPYFKLSGAGHAIRTVLLIYMDHFRYAHIPFKAVKGIKNGGRLEIFTEGRQSKAELFNNKRALTILANNGKKYRILPLLDDGMPNPDAYNLELKIFADVKTPKRKTSLKNAFQKGMKKASEQGAQEFIFHLKYEYKFKQYKDLYNILVHTLKENRNKKIQYLTIIYPNNVVKTYERKYLVERIIKRKGKH